MVQSRVALLSLVAAAQAATHTVVVGKGGLNFTPKSITAAKGDSVQFEFVESGHDVAEGSFSKPCQPSGDDAFYSGSMVKPGGKPFTIQVTSTDPIWYYCSTPSHCQNGMVGVINPPAGESVDAYAKAAGDTSDSKSPSSMQGGTFGAAPSSGSSSSAAMSSGSAASTMASSSGSMATSGTMAMSSTAGDASSTMMTSSGAAASSGAATTSDMAASGTAGSTSSAVASSGSAAAGSSSGTGSGNAASMPTNFIGGAGALFAAAAYAVL